MFHAKLLLALLGFRLLTVFFVQTAFVPDEIWQSIEVAHKWAYGYGALTWEWQPNVALRSPFHPLLFTLLYKIGNWLRVDSHLFIIYAPRVVHALLAAVADFHLYKLARMLSGSAVSKWALFHQLTNWFTVFCAPRTLSNNLEWSLSIIALAYYPWRSFGNTVRNNYSSGSTVFICLAITCVLIRPTALVIWAPLSGIHLLLPLLNESKTPGSRFRLAKLGPFLAVFLRYALTSCVLLLFSILLDRWAFGRWTMNQWNFVRFNLLTGGSQFYGTHPWHWYLTQGLPVMLFTQLPFLLVGIYAVLTHTVGFMYSGVPSSLPSKILLGVCFWTVVCYSALSHKEFRFLFSLLPILFYICGIGSVYILSRKHTRLRHAYLIGFLLCTQVPVMIYTCLIHQRGTLDAMHSIRNTISHQSLQDVEILVLMPCHSVPSTGYLHMNISIRQLSCDPELGHVVPFHDEAELFYSNPKGWLLDRYRGPLSRKPSFVLAFDHLFQTHPDLLELLQSSWNLTRCGRYFHAHFPTHSRHSQYLNILCRPPFDRLL